MKIVEYSIFTTQIKEGIIVKYQEDRLVSISNIEVAPSVWTSINAIVAIPPLEEDFDKACAKFPPHIKVQALPRSKVNENIAYFIVKYKAKYPTLDYQKQRTDASNMVNMPGLNPTLIDLYFTDTTWWLKQPKNIGNLYKNYNALLALNLANTMKKSVTNNYPDEPSAAYEKTLATGELSAYWAHLRAKGWVAKKNSLGTITGWVQKSNTT
jgi:hypothetical protein